MDEETAKFIVTILASGGLASLITALSMRKKNKADITNSNIETALKLRDEAIREYASIDEKLQMARELLDEVQGQLIIAKKYIDTLCDILDSNNIEYPPRPTQVYNSIKMNTKGTEDGEHNSKTA